MNGGSDVAKSLEASTYGPSSSTLYGAPGGHNTNQPSGYTGSPGPSAPFKKTPGLTGSMLTDASKVERGAEMIRSQIQQAPATPEGLVTASGESDLARMSRLLGANIGVDSRDHQGSTALMVAAWHGNAEAVGKLLSAGAALELKGADGETALHLAAWGGNVRCVELLLRGGASVESKDNDAMTPLMFAAWNGRLEATETLIRAGAKLDAMDTNGATSLMLAAEEGHADVLRALQRALKEPPGR